MYLPADQIPRDLNGRLWAQLIAPRPLALVSTQDGAGVKNIAPFSSYAALSNYPPLIGLSFGLRPDDAEKRTLVNIRESGEFVVNLVPRYMAEIMTQSASHGEPEDDFFRLNVTPAPSETVAPPRIVECPGALECRLLQIVALAPSKCEFVVAQVIGVYLRDEFASDEGFDPMAADLLASVGVEDYISLNGEVLTLPKTWE